MADVNDPSRAAPHTAVVLAAWFGTRAIRLGDTRARVPVVTGLVVAGGFILLNGLSALILVLS